MLLRTPASSSKPRKQSLLVMEIVHKFRRPRDRTLVIEKRRRDIIVVFGTIDKGPRNISSVLKSV